MFRQLSPFRGFASRILSGSKPHSRFANALPARAPSAYSSIHGRRQLPIANRAPSTIRHFSESQSHAPSSSAHTSGRETATTKRQHQHHHNHHQDVPSATVSNIEHSELVDLLARNAGDYTLIDVRGPDETRLGVIPTAKKLPLSQVTEALDEEEYSSKEFEDRFGFARPSSRDRVIFYCHVGLRSAFAGDMAVSKGFTRVQNYKGSWVEWIEKVPDNMISSTRRPSIPRSIDQ